MQRLAKHLVMSFLVLVILSTFVSAAKKEVTGQLNINTATEKELSNLPFIGAKKATAIIELRKQKPLQSLNELEKVRGISKKILAALEKHVKFSGESDLKVVAKK